MLHEARGVTDAVRGLVHGLAGEGWLAVAPHLYHRDGADELDGDDGQVQQQVDRLDGEQVMADTDTAFDWLAEHDIGTDRMGVIGFDLGGTVALLVAAERTLGAAVTVEGEGITEARSAALPSLIDAAPGLTCPWLGIYGEPARRRAPGAQAAARRGRVLRGRHRTSWSTRPADTASTTTRTPPPTPGSAPSTGSTRTCAESADPGGGEPSRASVCTLTIAGGPTRPREASPSLVYGAALLMRFGVTPHPGFKSRSLRAGGSGRSARRSRTTEHARARSSTDRASDYGSEG